MRGSSAGLWCTFGLLTALLAGLVSGTARAQGDRPFYEGKIIHLIVGTSAGEEYDTWARLIARHLPRHIPGKPTIVVENMPGGGHIIATNHLFNKAAQDGTVLGMVSRNMPEAALMKLPNVRFDPLKFNWIGTPEVTHRVLFVRPDAPTATADEIFTKELLIGAAGAGQSATTVPQIVKELLGAKFRIITGYTSPNNLALALDRGEIDGFVDTLNRSQKARVDAGKMRVLVNLDSSRLTDPQAPSIFEFTSTPEQRAVLSFVAGSLQLGRPMMAPPNVPQDRVDLLRASYDSLMSDADFLDEAARTGLDVSPRTGLAVEALVKEAVDTQPDIIARAGRAAAQ